jgi:hypothetical protein
LNTAEALEAITDRGKFELLATSVLRKSENDYSPIIHVGVNAQGEPIKSPVDGFCLVPRSDPPRFIFVQHTTVEKEQLKRKWLFDHTATERTKSVPINKDGDLVKAAREAEELRKVHPEAEFTVILTTNRRPSQDLIKEVYRKAAEFKITVDIWGQSRLTDFLDNSPNGHWLRRQYLGIKAEMLSRPLLSNLCKQSLCSYEKEFYLTSPSNWITREVDEHVRKGMHSNRCNIMFLIGESGLGKSVAAYHALKEHLESGGYGLWLPAELIKKHMTLENAIDEILRTFCPTLLPGAGKNVSQFIQEGQQFLVIVDDVSRTDAPTKLAHKLLAWLRPQQPDVFLPYVVICPIWPHIWGVINHDLNKECWTHTISVESMTLSEGMQAISVIASQVGIQITHAEAKALATKMGKNPIFIGLFGSLLSNNKSYKLNTLAENATEKFIEINIEEAASKSRTSYLPIDYREVLLTIGSHMLQKRRLHPFWREIRNWVDENLIIEGIRELIQHSKLCRLTDQKKLIFCHDCIQRALMAKSMVSILADPAPDLEILEEPFYAEMIGRALLFSPQKSLGEMQRLNILALVEAIRCFGEPTSDYHKSIIKEVKKWAKSNAATGSVPNSILDAVCWSLVETDSSAVLEITEELPSCPLVLLARLRNGCARSGAIYCNYLSTFAPSVNDVLRDQIIDHAKHRHEDKILKGLKQLLEASDASDKERAGALKLAGFLGFSDLQDSIRICWESAADKKVVFPSTIWAAAHCCGDEPKKLFDPLMIYWEGLSDEKDSHGIPEKMEIAVESEFAFGRGIHKNVIDYFVEQCDVHESLFYPIIYMCSRIDAPDAIELNVRRAAETGGSSWMLHLLDIWDTSRLGGRRLSQASIARLKALWEDPENDDSLKQQAFRLWLTAAERKQISILRAIPTDSPLFNDALWKRAQLGDTTAIPDLIPILSAETHWFGVAHYVWCKELMIAAEYHLERFGDSIPTDFSGSLLNAHYDLSELLMRIPAEDAETLLDKYWGHLGCSPLFIQTALYIGTPKCLDLADSSISECPSNIPIFQHLGSHFGFLNHERQKYLDKQHFEHLLPYLDLLGEHELWELAEVCQRLGIPEWSQEHLSHRLSERWRKRFHPTDNDLFQDLDGLVREKDGHLLIRFWLENFDKRHDPKNRALDIIDRWLASHPTLEGLRIAAASIEFIGIRKDLDILEKYTIEGSPDEIANMKESARYLVCRQSLE